MPTVYEIVVKGELGPTVAAAFEGMRVEARNGETVITGEVVDQSQLACILKRIHDLGLALMSVTPLENDFAGAAGPAGRTA